MTSSSLLCRVRVSRIAPYRAYLVKQDTKTYSAFKCFKVYVTSNITPSFPGEIKGMSGKCKIYRINDGVKDVKTTENWIKKNRKIQPHNATLSNNHVPRAWTIRNVRLRVKATHGSKKCISSTTRAQTRIYRNVGWSEITTKQHGMRERWSDKLTLEELLFLSNFLRLSADAVRYTVRRRMRPEVDVGVVRRAVRVDDGRPAPRLVIGKG